MKANLVGKQLWLARTSLGSTIACSTGYNFAGMRGTIPLESAERRVARLQISRHSSGAPRFFHGFPAHFNVSRSLCVREDCRACTKSAKTPFPLSHVAMANENADLRDWLWPQARCSSRPARLLRRSKSLTSSWRTVRRYYRRRTIPRRRWECTNHNPCLPAPTCLCGRKKSKRGTIGSAQL